MFGITQARAKGIVEMNAAIHSGLVDEDYYRNKPTVMGKVKWADFAREFAAAFKHKEETMISGIVSYIEQEYHSNIDKFSQNVIIAQLEVILTYAKRFYQRQFITRKISSHQIIERVEDILQEYFGSDILSKQGLPTVGYIADQLNVSPGYLSKLLKALTGLSTQQHIHSKLIEKAKEQLSTTGLSVSEIAYELGFEHLQSFSKLFKAKTNLSPLEFRQSFS